MAAAWADNFTGHNLLGEAFANRSAPVRRYQKRENRLRYLVAFDEASAHFIRDIHGHVTGPSFSGVEGNDADRIFILA